MRYLCKTCVEHVITLASYKHSPWIGGVSDHALTTHTYRGVEAIDPFITTQTSGTHTIARRMSDEREI